MKWMEGGAEGGTLAVVGAGVGRTVSFPVGAGVGSTVSFPVGAGVGCVVFEACEGDMLGETDEFVTDVGTIVAGVSVVAFGAEGARVGTFVSAWPNATTRIPIIASLSSILAILIRFCFKFQQSRVLTIASQNNARISSVTSHKH